MRRCYVLIEEETIRMGLYGEGMKNGEHTYEKQCIAPHANEVVAKARNGMRG